MWGQPYLCDSRHKEVRPAGGWNSSSHAPTCVVAATKRSGLLVAGTSAASPYLCGSRHKEVRPAGGWNSSSHAPTCVVAATKRSGLQVAGIAAATPLPVW